jgi:Xaa-Pro aminopeptidase/acetylornithine deacetylase/succinyl-diaminopimelate desuccinylase-like protein
VSAVPFTREDFAARMARVVADGQEAGVDGVLVTPGPDLVWLTGYQPTAITERLTMLLLTADREPTLLVPRLERPDAERADGTAATTVVDWLDGADPYAAGSGLLRPDGRYAISDRAWAMHLLGLQSALPAPAYDSVTGRLPMLRAVKDDNERARLAAAGAAADATYEEILGVRFSGRKETDVAGDLADLLRRHGHEQVDFTVVGSGPNGANPHHEAGERAIEPGDCVVLDRAARRVITEAGYGEQFIHRTGHGIGVTTHEPPSMIEGEELPLVPGMCFSVEPGIYLAGGDTGNAAVGAPAVTVSLRGMVNVVVHVEANTTELHSGMFGGPAPDALAALVAVLASLRDADGDTTVQGLDNTQTWAGAPYDPEAFRTDAKLTEAESLLGSGSVSDMLWARPALTILGIDCPPVVGSTAAIVPRASARLNLRIPPGIEPGHAEAAVRAHLEAATPWGVTVSVETEATGSPFWVSTDGAAYDAMRSAMGEAYGREMALLGQGGSIPLCNVFGETYPGVELLLMGVEEPLALIHAPNESVDPGEIQRVALAEALFLQRYRR